jgi:uroporphyrinogen-III synthase
LSLKPDLTAEAPTTAGIIATLQQHALTGRTVGVQLYGTEPNLPLMNFLVAAGARVVCVAPYIYADASDDQAVLRLLEELRGGTVDAIAFTSSAQIDRMFTVGAEEPARSALARTQVAAVGPIVADNLRQRGIKVSFMPDASFFMKPLTTLLEQELGCAIKPPTQ